MYPSSGLSFIENNQKSNQFRNTTSLIIDLNLTWTWQQKTKFKTQLILIGHICIMVLSHIGITSSTKSWEKTNESNRCVKAGQHNAIILDNTINIASWVLSVTYQLFAYTNTTTYTVFDNIKHF